MKYNLSEIYWAFSEDGKVVFPFVKTAPYKILNLDTNEYYNFSYCKHLEPTYCLKSLISMTHKTDLQIKSTSELFVKLSKMPTPAYLKCFTMMLSNLDSQKEPLSYEESVKSYCESKKIEQNKLYKLKNFFKKELIKNQVLEK